MLRILWATDIHLTAAEEEVIVAFCDRAGRESATALLLGGDTAESPELVEWLTFLADRIDLPIYFVLGNHEFYSSSIAAVRDTVRNLEDPRLHWLPHAGVVDLGDGVALVGQDGWGDARHGDFFRSPVILSDYIAIQDLASAFDLEAYGEDMSRQQALKEVLGRIGDGEAEMLRPTLEQAVGNARQVICLTHVPPFKEACWHKAGLSNDDWLPGVSCKAMGDLLYETAGSHPECSITVFCGHTHGHGVTDILPNLRVHTGEARYGTVAYKTVEIGEEGVEVGD